VLLALLIPSHTLVGTLATYVASAAAAAIYGAARVVQVATVPTVVRDSDETPALGMLFNIGLPVLGANLAAGLSQSADRILVSVTAPITSFALYGFASTITVAASAATQALSRVALSHAARWPSQQRAKFFGGFFDLIAAGFGILIIVEPLFERLVGANLPAYVAALPIVRALTLGSPFWIATHVVLVGTLQSHRLVRRQLVLELFGVTVVVVACGVAVMRHVPMWGVAAAATAAAMATFLFGTAFVRRAVPDARDQASLRFALTAAVQGAALLVALASSDSWPRQSATYAALAIVPTWLAARRAWEHGW
jgi:O-antigen/teichoic acid export membrane protein